MAMYAELSLDVELRPETPESLIELLHILVSAHPGAKMPNPDPDVSGMAEFLAWEYGVWRIVAGDLHRHHAIAAMRRKYDRWFLTIHSTVKGEFPNQGIRLFLRMLLPWMADNGMGTSLAGFVGFVRDENRAPLLIVPGRGLVEIEEAPDRWGD